MGEICIYRLHRKTLSCNYESCGILHVLCVLFTVSLLHPIHAMLGTPFRTQVTQAMQVLLRPLPTPDSSPYPLTHSHHKPSRIYLWRNLQKGLSIAHGIVCTVLGILLIYGIFWYWRCRQTRWGEAYLAAEEGGNESGIFQRDHYQASTDLPSSLMPIKATNAVVRPPLLPGVESPLL